MLRARAVVPLPSTSADDKSAITLVVVPTDIGAAESPSVFKYSVIRADKP
jgi:hypothetical protein